MMHRIWFVAVIMMSLFAGSPARAVIAQSDATPSPAAVSDWPMYRGGLGRTGGVSGSGPVGDPVLLWKMQAPGPISRTPAIAGGVAYLGGGDGVLYALDALTGHERWRYDAGESVENTPTVANGVVYVNSENGALLAVDAETGKARWRFAQPVATDSTPAVVNGMLYVGSDEGNLYAVDAATGKERWRFAAGGGVPRSPSYANGLLFFGTDNGRFHAIDAATGKAVWQWVDHAEASFVGTSTVANGIVYFPTSGAKATMHAMDAKSGAERWSVAIDGCCRPFSASGDMVFGAAEDGKVYAFDAATGKTRWSFQTGDNIQASPAVVGGVVYVASYDRNLYALDAADGQERWRVPIDGQLVYGPSVANGVVYASTDAGTLYAIGGTTSAAGAGLVGTPIGAKSATPAASASPVKRLWEYVDPTGRERGVSSISLAPDGNLWVLDGNAAQFQILAPDGAPVGRWGAPGAGPGQFNFVRDADNAFGSVTFAPDGSFYVADSHNFRIQQFDQDRRFVRAWGNDGQADGQFLEPFQVALDKEGNVYVIDDKRDDIQVFTPDGRFLRKFGGHGSGAGQLSNAGGGAFDAAGNFWIADGDNNRLEQFSPDGNLLRTIKGAPGTDAALDAPSGLAIDDAGRLFVGDYGSARVMIFAPDGAFLLALDGSEGGGTRFTAADVIVLDGQGNLYVHDYGQRESVQKYRLLAPAIGGAAGSP